MGHMSVSLAQLDVLPGGCSLVVEPDETGERVRFFAVDAEGNQSAPSGWFDVADAPIRLSWVAFDFETEERREAP